MPDLADFQARFAAALLSGDGGGVTPWLADPDAAGGFAVYRNNFVIGCADRLARAYPAVARLVGDRFFQAMAKAHIAETPPRDARLALYGGGLADFIEGFEPAARLPYLADVARLERAWTEAHHAPDAAPLTGEALAGMDPEAIAAMAPGLIGSARIRPSPWPAWSIWRANRADGDRSEQIALDQGGEIALVWRPGGKVLDARLSAAEAAFLGAIAGGAPLGDAAEAALRRDAEFDLAAAFGRWLSHGIFGSASTER